MRRWNDFNSVNIDRKKLAVHIIKVFVILSAGVLSRDGTVMYQCVSGRRKVLLTPIIEFRTEKVASERNSLQNATFSLFISIIEAEGRVNYLIFSDMSLLLFQWI